MSNRYRLIILCCVVQMLSVCGKVCADDYQFVWWNTNGVGQWADSTNWSPLPGENTLPLPEYPGTNERAFVAQGEVILTNYISVAQLQIEGDSFVYVRDGGRLDCIASLNDTPVSDGGNLGIYGGYVNIICPTATVFGLSVHVGNGDGRGYLDLGATWGTSTNFPGDFGVLSGGALFVENGGVRVDAGSISMIESCVVSNAGQELLFRGDWLNPDRTTTLIMYGADTNDTVIGGDFLFAGCLLNAVLDTNGVALVDVGGDAILTNASLMITATEALQTFGNTYDLLRVPVGNNILTNGMILVSGEAGNVDCEFSLEENRSGYNYLVVSPENFAPSVSITNPVDQMNYMAGNDVSIEATASDRDGTITKVEFFAGSQMLCVDTVSPYACVWSNMPAGSHTLSAVATDDSGTTVISAPISISADGRRSDGWESFTAGNMTITFYGEGEGGNLLPEVSIISPTNGSVFSVTDSIPFAVSASDIDGEIVNVQFLAGETGIKEIGSDSSSPYLISWTDSWAGRHSLRAKAEDDQGAVNASSYVDIIITTLPPEVSITMPTNSASYAYGSTVNIEATASDQDGTVTNVSFYLNKRMIGCDDTSPYTLVLTNVVKGGSLYARATDNKGVVEKSDTILFDVTPPPNIFITSPSDGDVFTEGEPIKVMVRAEYKYGTITNVTIYADSELISCPVEHPMLYDFIHNWPNPPLGINALTAKAIGDDGAQAVSAPVSVIFMPDTDSDNDGLPDWWELEWFGDLDETRTTDPDEDGFINCEEYTDRTDPTDPQSPGMYVYYVDDVLGSDTNSGAFSYPLKSISNAVARARSGYRVIVRPGSYSGAHNRNVKFGGRDILLRALKGATNTVIDCQGDGRAFEFVRYETSACRIEGFTIINGDVQNAGDNGGAIYCKGSSPTIASCIFSNNAAGNGGAIFFEESDAYLDNCAFIANNSGLHGGGVCVGKDTSVNIRHCTLSGNTAEKYGGGIACTQGGDASIINDIIWANTPSQIIRVRSSSVGPELLPNARLSPYGGGWDYHLTTNYKLHLTGIPTLHGSLTWDGDYQRGFFLLQAGSYDWYPNQYASCEISPISAFKPEIEIGHKYRCGIQFEPLWQNRVPQPSSPAYKEPPGNSVCVGFGGQSKTFSWEWQRGVALLMIFPRFSFYATAVNDANFSIHAGLVNSLSASGMRISYISLRELLPAPENLSADYSCIQGGAPGTGNITANPLFSVDGYHLSSTNSPCWNSGSSISDIATDIDNDPRPQGSGFDMGADEIVF